MNKCEIIKIKKVIKEKLTSLNTCKFLIVPVTSLRYDDYLDRLWYYVYHASNKMFFFNFFRKVLTFVKLFKGDYSQSWQPCAQYAAELIVQNIKIDCCIAEHSPDAGLFLAKWFSRKYNVPWIIDFRDPILQPLPKISRFFYTPFLRFFFKSTSMIINVNPYWSKLDSKIFKKPVFSITNGFDPDEFSSPSSMNFDRLTLGYFGNINKVKITKEKTGVDILFSGLFEFFKNNPEYGDKIQILFRGKGFKNILNIAKKYSIEQSINAAPAIERNKVLNLMQSSHALLLFSVFPGTKDIFMKRGYYPGKVFEYFGAKKPILCIPGDNGLLEALIKETQTGIVLRTSNEIVQCLKTFVDKWIQNKTIAYKPRTKMVRQYTRMSQAKLLASILDSIIESKE